jgi:hypothetical protein
VDSCARPGTVTDEDLVAYAYDEASPEVAHHVQHCPACARSAREYTHLQRRVGGAIHRFDCPTSHALGEYHLRLLPPDERASVAAHLAECPVCADEVRMLGRFLIDDPPAAPAGVGEQLKRIIATLLTPAPGLAYATVRGAGDAITRRYQAADLTIEARLGATAPSGYRQVSGVIWREGADAEDLTGRVLRLIGDDGGERFTNIGDLGDFDFGAIEPGNYRLEIETGDSVVVVEDLRLDSQ